MTGGTGFIGKNIQEQLWNKYDIIAPTHEELDFTDAIAVGEYLKKNPVDIVINAAAAGVSRGASTAEAGLTNLKIFYSLVRAKPYFRRCIMLGSGAEYDKRKSLVQVAESAFEDSMPADEYGFSKYVCAKYAEQVSYITHLRLFAVFGKYEDYTKRFISNVICMALFDLPITMKKNVRFDYLFIDDFVQILDQCIEKEPTEKIFNIGSGTPIDLYTLAEKIRIATGKNMPIMVQEEGFGNEYTPDINLMKNVFGNRVFTPIDDAIEKMVAYYREILPTLTKQTFETDP